MSARYQCTIEFPNFSFCNFFADFLLMNTRRFQIISTLGTVASTSVYLYTILIFCYGKRQSRRSKVSLHHKLLTLETLFQFLCGSCDKTWWRSECLFITKKVEVATIRVWIKDFRIPSDNTTRMVFGSIRLQT